MFTRMFRKMKGSRKRFSGKTVPVLFALCLTLSGGLPAYATPVPFQGSGLDAGGFQSTIAADPLHQDVLLSGADVAGINRSADGGDTWVLSNGGNTDKQRLQVASIVFSQTTSNKVYAAVGKSNGDGGFAVSTDGGQSWEIRNTDIKFVGGNTTGYPLPSPHPRSNGNLIALDETNGYIYAGTFKDGVNRSHDDGYTWDYIGLSGSYIRSIALNPTNANALFVAAYGEQLYKTTGAQNTSPSWTQISSSPLYLEELKYVGNTMYAVGSDGTDAKVYRLDTSPATLTQLLSTTGTDSYISIDGYVSGSNKVLFVGAEGPKQDGTLYDCVMRSTDSGATWQPITTNASNIHYEMGTSSNVWWLSVLNPDAMMGGPRYVANDITVDPFNNNRIFVAGRSGVWKGDIDSVTGGVSWHPIVRNLNATFNTSVLADPDAANPWRVYVGSTDWGFVYSTNSMTDVNANQPSTTDGYSLAADPSTTPSTVYLGDKAGHVWVNTNPVHGAAWSGTGLINATGGGSVVGVAVQQVGGTSTILAAVAGHGIWQKSGSTWTNVLASTSALGTQSTNKAVISWPSGSSYVYLYDRETGIWRSDNNGASGSWTKIWNHPITITGPEQDVTGYIVADAANPDTVFVSADDGLYKLTGATTGTVEGGGITKTNLTAVANPSAMTMDASGNLYVCTRYGTGTAAKLYESTDGGATFTDIADSFYHDNAGYPFDISVGGNGKIHVSLDGQGIIVGN